MEKTLAMAVEAKELAAKVMWRRWRRRGEGGREGDGEGGEEVGGDRGGEPMVVVAAMAASETAV